MNRLVRITTPSRLHFGLLRFAQDRGPSFGGLGMMIDWPRYVIELNPSDQWYAEGPSADRALDIAQRVLQKGPLPYGKALDVRIHEAPPPHAGLGSGTQLALAVATAVRSLGQRAPENIASLAGTVGRGVRSAVGSYGFKRGGLIWETGYLPGQTLGQLACRMEVPESWRILLISPHLHPGLYGESEADAFLKLPPVPDEVSSRLQQIVENQVLPAAKRADFNRFSESVYQYGHLSGSCFARVQGGPYASSQIAACIAQLRALGIAGVGQSSWGPTVFAFAATQWEAEALADRLPKLDEFRESLISLSAPNNCGAILENIAASDTLSSLEM
ncbi:MAG: hypothetical protein MI725_08835 [Pirellulales bacterium]|nr:hypothetical protein [Pirellulales bacterium]